MDTIEKSRAEKITEPPRRWRNWWEAQSDEFVADDATGVRKFVSKGDRFCGERIFPSKDLAETHAARLCEHNARISATPIVYLGAFHE